MATIKFTCIEESENISSEDMDKIYNCAPNGIAITAKDSEAPMCWDAVFEVEEIRNGNFLIHGGVGPSGYGSVAIVLPKKDVESFYDLTIEPENSDEAPSAEADIKYILNKYKFKILE